ncbi:type II toxin-antitoxin system VapC family toxin [Hydrocoleum sp. CS-953]|uniref:type II toxin-antitoxin system VapC family toxin n=1 Tax=Microcoleaceae TaxID=1892252 RepID=UPI000B9A5734|nr:PIN domain-containing protein [Hydrocoleum sp. CS-953]OZH51670.1 nucleic acid-binding protein, contains PIN domain protein [Hydrocoleum sp. CS-953]
MKTIFADTFYWIALINPRDNLHDKVIQISQSLQQTKIVTTEEILNELLTFYANFGIKQRRRTVKLVKNIIDRSDIYVVEQSHKSFLLGRSLYENRLDKGYSLTDCISMNTMNELEINEVLTHDRHFSQEGFMILLR